MAIFSDKIVSAKFIDPPNNMLIELLYREGDAVIPYTLEVDFTSEDFNDLLQEITLEEIEENTNVELNAEKQFFKSIVEQEIETRWAAEQDKIKAAYNAAEDYAQKVIEREYSKINSEYQKLEKASAEINTEYQKLEKASAEIDVQYNNIADQWKQIYDNWEKMGGEYQKLEKASGEINTEYQKLDKAYKRVDTYAEQEKGKKFQEVQEEFQKAREELQAKFNLAPTSSALNGKDVFAAIDENNQDNDFVFNLKVSILEDPLIAKSRDKKLKLAIRKSKSVLELLKIYAEIKEAA